MNNTTEYFAAEAVSPQLMSLLNMDLGFDVLSLFVLIMFLFYVLALLSKNERLKHLVLRELGMQVDAPTRNANIE
jgi:hypothetical protein